jgi:hypothetical protein
MRKFEKGWGMHQELQRWRTENSSGYIINVKSSTNAMLHTSECRIHFGDVNITEERYNLGNKTKICSNDKSELIEWAKKEIDGILKECKSCKP